MRYGVILGRHSDVWTELDAAKQLIRSVAGQTTPVTIIATKRAGRDYDGPVHEWPSFHPELFKPWIAIRAKYNRPPALRLWSARSPRVKKPDTGGLVINWLASQGGSSGMLGVQVGLAIGHPPYQNEPQIDRLILCGIPMEKSKRYDDNQIWREAELYREHWIKFFGDNPQHKDRVRSMSGWTKELLGGPTEEWLTP